MIKGILIGLLSGIILIILGVIIPDIMNPPEITRVTTPYGKFCPNSIKFDSGNGMANFEIKVKNSGDDGILFVKLNSDKLISRKNNEGEYTSNSEKAWPVDSKKIGTFGFDLKEREDIENIENFTISLDYGCYEKIIGLPFGYKQENCYCDYQKETYRDEFKLLNETCFR